METVDRIACAVAISSGRKVLDIGGQKMAGCDPDSPFAKEYSKIERASSDYRIVDYQRSPTVDYVVDFNTIESIGSIKRILSEYKPDIILCMELLEHVNYHFELMNELAAGIENYNAEVFITVPNNGNWVFNAMGWNHDHNIAFFKDIAIRFVNRSKLGRHDIKVYACMQKYLWYWRIAYAAAFFQPFSWGFHIKKKDSLRINNSAKV